jgi:Ca2+-binding EF-hand superfamily protein
MSGLPKYFLTFLISGIISAKETKTGIESLPKEAREQIQQDAANIATEWLPTLRTLTSHTQEKITLNAFIQKLMPYGFAKVGGLSARDAEDPPDRWDIRRRENDAKNDRKFINALQHYSDDQLTYESFAKTIESILAIWPNKLLPLDADGDEKITLAEYAASSPLIQEQDTDEEGFSKDQRRRFAYYDDNKNGVIEGAEILSSSTYHHKTMRQYMSTILIARADLNQDSTLSKTELEKLIPQAKKLPKSVPLSEALFWLRRLDSDDLTSVRDQLLGQTTRFLSAKENESRRWQESRIRTRDSRRSGSSRRLRKSRDQNRLRSLQSQK